MWLGSPLTPSLHKRHYMLPMKIYTYLSYRRKINETDVSHTYNLQKYEIDSSDSLNGSGCSLSIFIRSTIPMISGDFLTRWNAITFWKGQGKRTILRYFIFLHRSLRLANNLRRNHLHAQPFKLRRGQYVNYIALRKQNFLDFFWFCVQNLCGNDSKYHSFNWKDVLVTNVDFFEKKQFSLQFSITCYRFT